jgi:DNA-binding NarL/FixJ family response regulator
LVLGDGDLKRILIIDGQPLMREALRLVIRSIWPTANIVEAGSLAQAEAACSGPSPIQLAVIDPNLPDVEGLTGLVMLDKLLPRTPIVVFSTTRASQTIASCYILGAAAYVAKSALMSEVASTLQRAATGERVFDAAEAPTESARGLAVTHKRLSTLSPAQLRVLVNVAGGRLNKQVAADMNVTEATIKAHMTAIFRKLQVLNRSQAILAVQPFLREQLAA